MQLQGEYLRLRAKHGAKLARTPATPFGGNPSPIERPERRQT